MPKWLEKYAQRSTKNRKCGHQNATTKKKSCRKTEQDTCSCVPNIVYNCIECIFLC